MRTLDPGQTKDGRSAARQRGGLQLILKHRFKDRLLANRRFAIGPLGGVDVGDILRNHIHADSFGIEGRRRTVEAGQHVDHLGGFFGASSEVVMVARE